MTPHINEILQGMAEDILRVMQYILDANNLGNSNLKRDLEVKVSDEGDNAVIRLLANHYIYWVDKGRNPTKMPPLTRWADPVGDISDWCRRKGIPSDNQTVWKIITKIHKYGYEGKFFLEDFWKDAEESTYDNLDKLADGILKDITDWFNK